MTTMMTLDYAAALEQEHRQAAQLAADATERRNEAVLLLLESGEVRQSEIAAKLGITPSRVSQIADRARAQRTAEPVAA